MTDHRAGSTDENAHTEAMAHDATSIAVDFDAIAFDADRALAPHRLMPPPQEIADLTERLIAHGARLVAVVERVPEAEHTVRAKGALKDWYDLTESGPGDGAMANWVHMRAMARMCRTFMDYLREREGRGRP
ncbi:DUF6415 family natural product biosynthesis protein [Streptomyces sp. MnatMP-M17]|uniref:DUF6415 family natural product biosynthesis protein n=1 Tax=unclassified Streptomyces TaxID=2593676 RepID=UPI00081DBD99|nr:DUF6415 family natural product biosynthesis protein [Streptomyces sp. MnatMP-M17]MYZ37189.1 hypothetical protein [Streptomyces sp. SID4917]SCF89446.1 hypothetical protein GA0115259_104345 [Streptomyces sp. MnatMP-M17]